MKPQCRVAGDPFAAVAARPSDGADRAANGAAADRGSGAATVPSATAAPSARDERRGLALGLLGVAIFAVTTPMTRLAVGDAAAPQLSPLFVTAGRAAAAGLLSLAWLLATRAPRPRGGQWRDIAVTALGVVLGFPLGLALALREVPAIHAAVVTGVLPLGTAVAAALLLRQRGSPRFWGCALAGCAVVLGYAAWQGGGRLVAADALLLGAVASASVGYVVGARLSAALAPEQVICWVLVASLPVTLPLAAWAARDLEPAAISAGAWLGFGYVALFSMWLGFFAWYRGLALGGALRVSQVQLLQPFLSALAAVPLLGERLDGATVACLAAVIALVFAGRRAGAGASGAAARRPAADGGPVR
jgi:drug/metabolite transporter (DMT)-like permease